MLPKIEYPTFDVTVPSLKKKVKMRLMLVREEKILLMAKQGGISEQVQAIKQVVNNCLLDKLDVDTLPSFDIEFMFVQLRARSINNKIDLIVTDGEDGEKYNVQANLDDAYVSFEGTTSPKIEINDTTGIIMKYPTYDEYDAAISSKDPNSVLIKCIDKVYDAERVYTREDFDEAELSIWVDKLSIQAMEKIEEFFQTMPILTCKFTYTTKDGKEKSGVLEGLSDFFTFA